MGGALPDPQSDLGGGGAWVPGRRMSAPRWFRLFLWGREQVQAAPVRSRAVRSWVWALLAALTAVDEHSGLGPCTAQDGGQHVDRGSEVDGEPLLT